MQLNKEDFRLLRRYRNELYEKISQEIKQEIVYLVREMYAIMELHGEPFEIEKLKEGKINNYFGVAKVNLQIRLLRYQKLQEQLLQVEKIFFHKLE